MFLKLQEIGGISFCPEESLYR